MNLREAQPLGDPGRDLFAHAELDFGAPAMTVRVAEPPPGEAAEVDFGRLGLWQDPIAGPARTVLDDNRGTSPPRSRKPSRGRGRARIAGAPDSASGHDG